jgi:hypothetical protein
MKVCLAPIGVATVAFVLLPSTCATAQSYAWCWGVDHNARWLHASWIFCASTGSEDLEASKFEKFYNQGTIAHLDAANCTLGPVSRRNQMAKEMAKIVKGSKNFTDTKCWTVNTMEASSAMGNEHPQGPYNSHFDRIVPTPQRQQAVVEAGNVQHGREAKTHALGFGVPFPAFDPTRCRLLHQPTPEEVQNELQPPFSFRNVA